MSVERLAAPELPHWLELMVEPFDRYRVDVGGGVEMHVMESGEGRPVVLQHGNPMWGFLYRRVAERLTGQKLRLIMPDLVGFGFSSRLKSTADHTFANHAAWFGNLIDALDLRDLILVAQDWGGPISTLAMADRPERVAGLVLMNTAVGPPKEGFKPTFFHRLAQTPVVSDALFKGLGYPQLNLNMAQGERDSITGPVAKAYQYPLRSWHDRGVVLAMAREVPDSLQHRTIPLFERCEQFVGGFDGPAAIVWGDRDPVLGKLKNRTSRLLPQATVTSTSAGHFLQEQVPVEIADAIREVAAQLE